MDEDETQYEQLFTAVVLAKEGGRELCEMFKLLPSKTVSILANLTVYFIVLIMVNIVSKH